MSGLFASLNASVKALGAHSRAIEVTGKNLANVNNTAYARQRVIYGDRGTVVTPTGAESLGLEALGVQQMRDSLLDRQVMREIALKASFESEQSGYQRAQAGLGQSIDRSSAASVTGAASSTGLSAAIDDFFNAFQSFAARPTDQGERQTLVQKAGILTDRFQLADARIDQVQSDLEAEVETDVEDVNRLLTTIAELNSQIARFEVNLRGGAVDLRDQRQARLEELAAKLPVEVSESSSGHVKIVVRAESSDDDVVLVDQGVLSTVDFDSNQLSVAGVALARLAGGSINGALNARDQGIQRLRTDLNNLAAQMVKEVNTIYGEAGAAFFQPAGTTAGSIKLASTLSAATLKAGTGAAGDNSIALRIAELANRRFATPDDAIDGTFGGFYSKSVSMLGQALASANSRVEDQTNIERLVRGQRDGVSGVSLDEEMADLMKYQRAFQASSRVFSVMDELLEVVVNRL